MHRPKNDTTLTPKPAPCAYCGANCPPARGGWKGRPRRFCCTNHNNRFQYDAWRDRTATARKVA